MHLMLWPRNEGFMDDQFRDGDIFQVMPDSWTPGSLETQRFLVVSVPGLEYSEATAAELTKSDYTTGPGGEPVMLRQRAYRVDWRAKLTPEEVAQAEDPFISVPVVTGRFTVADIARK